MKFVHENSIWQETITAIATPPGEGGVAIIRVSGPKAIPISARLFSGPLESYATHTVHLGYVVSETGNRIDQALVAVFKGPRSFTGEDTVEFQCHGGAFLAKKILERVVQAGARPAKAGEFALKAFMNGKIDLTQAEAIQDLIGAQSEQALKAAEGQLEGRLTHTIQEMQKQLTHIAAILEAWVDFPEEDLEFAPFEDVIQRLDTHSLQITQLVATYEEGRRLRDGIQVSLVGAPNVGKSSLMNALIGFDRSIVSEVAGTTRDLVHEDVKFSGIVMRLVDTAGIRKGAEIIEEEGIRRSKKAIDQSDLILLVLDSTRPDDHESRALLEFLPPQKTIAIWNKCDLAYLNPLPDLGIARSVRLSALELSGLDTLKKEVEELIWQYGAPLQQQVTITNIRHKNALSEAALDIERASQGLKNKISAEFVAFDVHSALVKLGTIIGTNVSEDILDAIFSSFCIGK